MKNSVIRAGLVSLAALTFSSQAVAADSDVIIDAITCAADEDLFVKDGGVEDNYGPGIDTVNPAPNVVDSPHIVNFQSVHGSALRQYDDGGNDRFFVERLNQMRPSNRQAMSGTVIMKFRPTGSLYSTDSLLIGDLKRHGLLNQLGQAIMPRNVFGAWSTTAMPGADWTETNGMFVGDLATLRTADGTRTMLEYVNSLKTLDFILQDDSEVDFIKVALCLKQ